MGNKQYCAYILTNSRHRVLYTGVTNNLERRTLEHKTRLGSASTRNTIVINWFIMNVVMILIVAIAREKQIKAGSRQDKINLINGINPEWKDLSKELWE